MTPDELAEWEAYYELEPWGTKIEDDRWRNLYELLWYCNYKGDLNEGFHLDRDPEETARRREMIAAATLGDRIDAFFAARPKVVPEGRIEAMVIMTAGEPPEA